MISLLSHEVPVVSGSLSMYPPADDNYGIDSCSIMCIQTTPPIVVIAMCTGKIYHAILLKEELNDDDDDRRVSDGPEHPNESNGILIIFSSINNLQTWSQYGSTYSLHTPEEALYIYECVEIELGLFFADNDEKYNCPIHLRWDKDNKSRYNS